MYVGGVELLRNLDILTADCCAAELPPVGIYGVLACFGTLGLS